MNLIEQLGGYEKSKWWEHHLIQAEKKGIHHNRGNSALLFTLKELQSSLLEYRRDNNIFEVGDVVVGRCYSDFDDALLTITKKFTHDGKPCVVFECTRTICDDFESEIRHAKPEELKVGHRL